MVYGQITYSERFWRVEGEPFVRARLKRVFPRVPQKAATQIMLSASPENTRELLWFIQRYPMEMSAGDAQIMAGLAAMHVDAEIKLAELMAGKVAPANVELAEPARDYQTFAAQMLVLRGGLLLADDVGLGKTVSAIASTILAGQYPVLIVVPAHLTKQWAAQLKRFAPGLTTHILKQSTPYDLTPRKRGAKATTQLDLIRPVLPDVIITSYHMLRGWGETLTGVAKMVVFDECQALRNPGTAIHAAASMVAGGSSYRLGLSATPIYNYGGEFYHVINVLVPDALGEHGEFIREWCTDGEGGKPRLKEAKDFGAYLRREGIMLRRTRKDVGRELPKLTKIVHEVSADEKALNELKGNAVALARVVLSHNEQFRGQKMQAAGEFDMLMRQATGIAKAPYVIEFMKVLLDSGEPVVLFGWHRAVYDLWMEGLAEFNPVLYTGTESASQKTASVEAFLNGSSKLLIVSLRSGAGLDGLQSVCNTAVVGELDWSPAVLEQCIGRVDRDGQTQPCTAFYLVSESGADPYMAEVLGVKREQIEAVRNPDMALAERIDTGGNSIRRMAREFLMRRNEPIPSHKETIEGSQDETAAIEATA
jgi:SNF2 family DNA or RNA helicase